MKYQCFLLLILSSLFSCTKKLKCIAVVDEDCITTLEYAPVCGCDGVTYGNASAARCAQVDYTEGACNDAENKLIGTWKFLGFEKADKINQAFTEQKHPYAMDMKIELVKNEFTFGGRSSVNTYGGTFTILRMGAGEGKLKVNPAIWSTKIAGSLEANQYEGKYYEALSTMDSYALIGNVLFLNFNTSKESDRLVYLKVN